MFSMRALLLDLARRLLGNDAEPRLHARQRALDVEVVADRVSSENTPRISSVLKMSRKIAESSAVAGIVLSKGRVAKGE